MFIDGDWENPIHFERGDYFDYVVTTIIHTFTNFLAFSGQEDITTEKLFLFLKEHSKVYIQAPGCNQKLDELTEKFMKEKNHRLEIMKKAEQSIEKIDCAEVIFVSLISMHGLIN